jgi:hypothetical protein
MIGHRCSAVVTVWFELTTVGKGAARRILLHQIVHQIVGAGTFIG